MNSVQKESRIYSVQKEIYLIGDNKLDTLDNNELNVLDLVKLPITTFTKKLEELKINPSQNLIEKYAAVFFIMGYADLMKTLIKDFNFIPTEIFIKEIGRVLYNMKASMVQLLIDLANVNIFDIMECDMLVDLVGEIFITYNHELGKIFINSNIVITNLYTTQRILKYVSASTKYFLRYLLDNGMKIISDEYCNIIKIFYANPIVIDIFIECGFDFNIINNIEVPPEFKKSHQKIVDLGVDPLKMVYLLR